MRPAAVANWLKFGWQCKPSLDLDNAVKLVMLKQFYKSPSLNDKQLLALSFSIFSPFLLFQASNSAYVCILYQLLNPSGMQLLKRLRIARIIYVASCARYSDMTHTYVGS